jgi:hypothetical protein
MVLPYESLVEGPRGRRLCLELAMELEPDVRSAVFELAYELDPGAGSSRVLLAFMAEDEASARPSPSPIDGLTALLGGVDLGRIDDDTLRDALRRSVDTARYWQEPDGEDVLAADPLVRSALRPVAERVAASTAAHWWDEPRPSTQWVIEWRSSDDPSAPRADAHSVLAEWRREQRAEEERARHERPTDPTANWSGTWWSIPTRLLRTVGRTSDGLDLVEDSLGWEEAVAIPVSGAGRTIEIRGSDDWVALCRRFPLEVTASRRHDWFRVSGRDGRWVIPDWRGVADHWDAAHLTVLGYLSGATRSLAVDDETATIIAGWNPGSTIWFSDVASKREGSHETWRRDAQRTWRRTA